MAAHDVATGRAIGAYLTHLSVERGLAANSLAAYRRDLDRYQGWLARHGRAIGDVSAADIDAYVVALRTGDPDNAALAASSTARALSAVRGLHKFLAGEGITGQNPAVRSRPPLQGQRLPRALDTAQVEAILAAAGAGDGPAALRDKALLEFLYGTGARISEAVGLDIDDLDIGADVSSVRLFGKGSKTRVVPVGSYAAEALSAYLVRGRPALAGHGTGGPGVFLNTRGGRLSRQSAWTVLRSAVARAGLGEGGGADGVHVSPHTLRHSFATHLLQGGADVRVVQELLGHASVTTTQIYTRVTADHVREVYLTAHPRALVQPEHP